MIGIRRREFITLLGAWARSVIGVAARWNDMLVEKLLMLAVFAVIGAAAAVGHAIAFPIWLARFPG
jgi:hypothetical protein